jgi:hypothetical protein
MPISAPVAGLIGTGIELFGGLFSNKKNIDLAREQMAFQREMANTQFQRAAKDLEKAGLNRILALGSPAAAPAGARPTIVNPAQGMANSAANLVLLKQQEKLLKEQVANIGMNTQKLSAEALRAQAEAGGRALENIITGMKVELFREKPWLFEAQQISNPASVGVSAAGQLLRGGSSALKSILKGKWK